MKGDELKEDPGGQSQGPATDRQNTPVVDPTANVLQLVEAAIQRQDDLRGQDREHQKEIAAIDREHSRELREAEAKRIDAIRAVDVGAVAAAAAVQTTQASTLAAQVATSAEALRNQVAAAASAQTVALAAALEPIIKDIADLRRAQYEAQGEKGQRVESRAGSTAIGAWVFGGIASVVAVFSVILAIYVNSQP